MVILKIIYDIIAHYKHKPHPNNSAYLNMNIKSVEHKKNNKTIDYDNNSNSLNM